MKQIFTLLTLLCLSCIVLDSNSQTCGTGGTFTPGASNSFTTTAENFTGDFNWSGTGSGELVSTEASAGQIKKLRTSKYTLPVNATSLNWSFKLAGTMNVQTYSVIAYYYVGTTVSSLPICSGGSLSTVGNYHSFFATAPAELLGRTYQLEITFNSSTNPSSKTLNIDEFSTNGFSSNITLPIKLLSFHGSLNDNKASLSWSVADNETGEHFQIEKSDDGKSFTTEAYVFTTKKVAAESYTYHSPKNVTGQIYYRLKIVNNDGSVDHSRTIVLKTAKAGNNNKLVILQNPVASTLMFQYTSTASTKGIVNIYNTSGARMLTTSINIQTGMNAASINLNGKLNSGTYLLEVINGAERTVSKLIKK